MQSVGHTDDLSLTCAGDRGDEIAGCVAARAQGSGHVGVAWVALDDMDLSGMNPRAVTASHFVRTDDEVGLSVAGAHEAVAKLQAAATSEFATFAEEQRLARRQRRHAQATSDMTTTRRAT
jgi:hypothetical protein